MFAFIAYFAGKESNVTSIVSAGSIQRLTAWGTVGAAAPTWMASYGASSLWPIRPSPTEKKCMFVFILDESTDNDVNKSGSSFCYIT